MKDFPACQALRQVLCGTLIRFWWDVTISPELKNQEGFYRVDLAGAKDNLHALLQSLAFYRNCPGLIRALEPKLIKSFPR